MNKRGWGLATALLIVGMWDATIRAAERECVLDRKVHVEKELIAEIPKIAPLCDQLPGLSKQRVDLPGVTLYCEQEGEGPPLVLLHGGPGATHHEFHPAMSKFRGFARLIYYDQRGCGQSEYKPGKGYSVDQAVDDLHHLRQALKLSKWFVLGHSYGGALAQCLRGQVSGGLVGADPGRLGRARPGQDGADAAVRLHVGRGAQEDRRVALGRRLLGPAADLQCLSQRRLETAVVLSALGRGVRPHRLVRVEAGSRFQRRHERRFAEVRLSRGFRRVSHPHADRRGRMGSDVEHRQARKAARPVAAGDAGRDRSRGPQPFADQPEEFARLLKRFLSERPPISDADVARWKDRLLAWKAEKEKSAEFVLRTSGCGRKANRRIAEQYRPEWLDQVAEPFALLHLGMALYDVKRYPDALAVFARMEQAAHGDKFVAAVSGIWQAQMLDLMGKRDQAVALYAKVRDSNVGSNISHDQFRMRYSPSAYAADRMKEPFVRRENAEE